MKAISPILITTVFGDSFALYILTLTSPPTTTRGMPKRMKSESSWSIGDDWSRLSEIENGNHFLDEDPGRSFAYSLEQPIYQLSEEDQDIYDIIEEVHNQALDSHTKSESIYDSEWDNTTPQISFEDKLASEISMLVRCNGSPHELLIEEGRALPPLTKGERDDITQLVKLNEDNGIWEPTRFFLNAIDVIFREHSNEDDVMKASNVASWMSKSVNEYISSFDRRIVLTIARFSKYGNGYLTKLDFEQLYKVAIQNALDNKRGRMKEPTVESIWRDIRNHNILSPIETEREIKLFEMKSKYSDYYESTPSSWNEKETMDECEISDLKSYDDKKSKSHELVEMANDGKTPLYIFDGDFVFIDEDSCVGCRKCETICPSSFLMLDDGRARTFQQQNGNDVKSAIESCPVNCMHRVSFDELKQLETVRDHGDGRSDHRYLGKHTAENIIPLHVAGMDSDRNRKSSWYHYVKQKCYMSKDCPKKGCYACPNYSNAGDNPYWKQKHSESQHIRAKTFIDRGLADKFRKTAEL